MNGTVFGYIDSDINYCPYCGERLSMKGIYGDTECDECGKRFCVVEGENEEDEDND